MIASELLYHKADFKCSLWLSFILPKAIDHQYFINKTPIPKLEVSHSTVNGFEKSGVAKAGVGIIILFNGLKHFFVSLLH